MDECAGSIRVTLGCMKATSCPPAPLRIPPAKRTPSACRSCTCIVIGRMWTHWCWARVSGAAQCRNSMSSCHCVMNGMGCKARAKEIIVMLMTQKLLPFVWHEGTGHQECATKWRSVCPLVYVCHRLVDVIDPQADVVERGNVDFGRPSGEANNMNIFMLLLEPILLESWIQCTRNLHKQILYVGNKYQMQ